MKVNLCNLLAYSMETVCNLLAYPKVVIAIKICDFGSKMVTIDSK